MGHQTWAREPTKADEGVGSALLIPEGEGGEYYC